MTSSTTIVSRFIGCDVGKNHIAVFDSIGGKTVHLDNAAEALTAFARSLDTDCLVVCETTGGHEAALLAALVKAGVPAHRADARKVKAFIRSFGTLGKTDALDARALARYGAERHGKLVRWRAPDALRARLQALVLTRRDLVDDRVAYKNRLTSPGAETVAPYLQALITCLSRQIDAIEAEIQALLARSDALARTHRVLDRNSRPRQYHRHNAPRPHARTRNPHTKRGRFPRRPRSPPKAKRYSQRLPPNPRRTSRGQAHPLHGRPRRLAVQSRT